ncbi:NAD-dependent epimerase/dehydratase family protein [Buttiauxella sp. A2-C2_NF]|uniref:NAD-dependent epimerase/dehydratase family protein n=1 Tax=Buttiauxella ferragutiae TaxID=82989 RepID=UPI001E585510|nr:NAD-dependent epimerase/dehydratase family protein [Buttiauxella ferragutiae]MCE0826697.1 NAD-dependent epimerase/dehydratase family protein [Buttiauxella ferragutiae]
MVNVKKILITGGNGFIGKHLLKKLLSIGCDIIAMKRFSSSIPPEIQNNITWINWEELELYENNSIMDGLDTIIHLATNYGRGGDSLLDVYECNVLKPLLLLELAKKYNVKKFISTDSFFGKYEKTYKYMESYILTKRHFLEMAKIVTQNHPELSFVNMRLEHVYGENDQSSKFVSYVIKVLASNQAELECTSGEQKRDFIYIEDVISAFDIIIHSDLGPGINEYEVGTGCSRKLSELINEIKSILESKTDITFGAISLRSDEIMDSYAATESLTKLGWKSNYNLEQGLNKMLKKG